MEHFLALLVIVLMKVFIQSVNIRLLIMEENRREVLYIKKGKIKEYWT